MCGFATWLSVKDEPYHPSSLAEFVLVVLMLVSVVTLVSVVKLVLAVTLSDDEAPDLELLRVVVGVEFILWAAVTFASGDAGVLGEAILTPLSTLRKERCTGLGSDDVRLESELARSKGWRTRLAANHVGSFSFWKR